MDDHEVCDVLKEEEGKLIAVVNNAGVMHCGPTELIKMETAKQMFEVNVFGVLGVTQVNRWMLVVKVDFSTTVETVAGTCHHCWKRDGLSFSSVLGNVQ